jgi:hypothetical protein
MWLMPPSIHRSDGHNFLARGIPKGTVAKYVATDYFSFFEAIH